MSFVVINEDTDAYIRALVNCNLKHFESGMNSQLIQPKLTNIPQKPPTTVLHARSPPSGGPPQGGTIGFGDSRDRVLTAGFPSSHSAALFGVAAGSMRECRRSSGAALCECNPISLPVGEVLSGVLDESSTVTVSLLDMLCILNLLQVYQFVGAQRGQCRVHNMKDELPATERQAEEIVYRLN